LDADRAHVDEAVHDAADTVSDGVGGVADGQVGDWATVWVSFPDSVSVVVRDGPDKERESVAKPPPPPPLPRALDVTVRVSVPPDSEIVRVCVADGGRSDSDVVLERESPCVSDIQVLVVDSVAVTVGDSPLLETLRVPSCEGVFREIEQLTCADRVREFVKTRWRLKVDDSLTLLRTSVTVAEAVRESETLNENVLLPSGAENVPVLDSALPVLVFVGVAALTVPLLASSLWVAELLPLVDLV
jgi:hypothetical protein